jgi:hypothetical protein
LSQSSVLSIIHVVERVMYTLQLKWEKEEIGLDCEETFHRR